VNIRNAVPPILICCAFAAHAQNPKTDMKFASTAASGGMAEVALSQIAASKAQNPQVKQFSQRMIADHTKANEELDAAAAKDGVKVPHVMTDADKAKAARLQKLDGAEFDREYASMMVQDHEKTVALFEKESNSGKDSNVKTFAQQTLPTLKEHLDMAKAIDNGARATKAMSKSKGE